MAREFFVDLPPGKSQGFCESYPDGSGDNGVVVEILKDCVNCTVARCMMFEAIIDGGGDIIGRKYTPHSPQY